MQKGGICATTGDTEWQERELVKSDPAVERLALIALIRFGTDLDLSQGRLVPNSMTDNGHRKKGSRIPKYSRLLAGFGSKFHILFLPPCWHKDTRRFAVGTLPAVLIIEETAGEQKQLLACLANCQLSAKVSVLNSGQAAFDFLVQNAAHHEPILLIVDADAQFENGFGLVEKMRANEFLRDIPISIVGAAANEDHLASAIDLGAVSYVVKPTTDDQNIKLAKVFGELFSSLVRPAHLTEMPT